MKLAALFVIIGAWLTFGETVVAPEQQPSAASVGASQWSEPAAVKHADFSLPTSVRDRVKTKSAEKTKNTPSASSAEGAISQIVRNMVSGDWECWRRSLDFGLLAPNARTTLWEGADRGRYALSPDAPVADHRLNQPWLAAGEQTKPLAAADVSANESTGRSPALYNSLLASLWQWRQVLIAAPALCGLALLFVHASLRLFRWNRHRRQLVAQRDHAGLEDDRAIPSPFIASIVERERRRSIERNRVREEREAAMAGKKKDMSRAA